MRAPTSTFHPDADRIDLVFRVTMRPNAAAAKIEKILAELATKIGGKLGRVELHHGGTRILRRVKVR